MPSRELFGIMTFAAWLAFAGCARHEPAPARDVTSEAVPIPSSSSESRGAALFAKNCAACHGERGVSGPVGPSLAGEHRKKRLDAIVTIVEHPDPPMPKLFPGTLSAQDVADIAAYVESL